jgi:hypothetical protein
MTHPQLVPIFFSDDPDVTTLAGFHHWLVTSDWLGEVGAEYGVGTGSVLGTAQLSTPAPLAITDAQVKDLVFQGVASGSLPRPGSGSLGDVLYMLYVPRQTAVTAGSDASCVDFAGYHSAARRDGVELSYAVIATCAAGSLGLSDVEYRELIASHEVIEAATDPLPGKPPRLSLARPDHSLDLHGRRGRRPLRAIEPSGLARARLRRAAQLVEPRRGRGRRSLRASPGQHGVLQPEGRGQVSAAHPRRWPPAARDQGWSTGKVAAWKIDAAAVHPDNVKLTLGASQLNAEKVTTLDVAFPATAKVGGFERLYLFSVLPDHTYEPLPMFAVVGDPCASFTGCEACTAQIGCGFCATTGRCENVGASGSADSACPVASFAEGLGDCPGYCAAHSESCQDCASQPGCGWCDAGAASRCVGIDRETLLPQDNACPYASWDLTPGYCPQ